MYVTKGGVVQKIHEDTLPYWQGLGWAVDQNRDGIADSTQGSGTTVGALVGKGDGSYVPSGSLDRWKAARAASSTTLAEVTFHGDSTTYGQVQSNALGSAGEYSYVNKVRQLAIAAGFGDGGIGLRGIQDNAAMALPDTGGSGLYTLGTGAVAGSTTHNFHGAYGVKIAAIGDTFSFTFTGTRLRIWRSRTGTADATPGGSFTYSIDGGAASGAISCQNTSTGNYDMHLTTQNVTEGTHTVVVTCTVAGPCELAMEVVRTTGLAFHKQGISGVLLANEFPSQTPTAGERIPPRFGLGIGAGTLSTASNYGSLSKTAGLRTGLHVLNLGLNDQNSSTSLADARTRADSVAAGVSMFARYCELAGSDGLVVIPHLLYMNSTSRQYEGIFRQALIAPALSHGLAVFDTGQALGGWKNFSTYGTSVHLNQAGYDAQAAALWAFLAA